MSSALSLPGLFDFDYYSWYYSLLAPCLVILLLKTPLVFYIMISKPLEITFRQLTRRTITPERDLRERQQLQVLLVACTEESFWPLSIKTTANLDLQGSHLMPRLPTSCLGKAHRVSPGHGSTGSSNTRSARASRSRRRVWTLIKKFSATPNSPETRQNNCYTPCSLLITKLNYSKII